MTRPAYVSIYSSWRLAVLHKHANDVMNAVMMTPELPSNLLCNFIHNFHLVHEVGEAAPCFRCHRGGSA